MGTRRKEGDQLELGGAPSSPQSVKEMVERVQASTRESLRLAQEMAPLQPVIDRLRGALDGLGAAPVTARCNACGWSTHAVQLPAQCPQCSAKHQMRVEPAEPIQDAAQFVPPPMAASLLGLAQRRQRKEMFAGLPDSQLHALRRAALDTVCDLEQVIARRRAARKVSG